VGLKLKVDLQIQLNTIPLSQFPPHLSMPSPLCELSPPSFEIKLRYAKSLFLSSSPPFFEKETKKVSLQKLMDKNHSQQKKELKEY
jgi:hypothetical protein